ncbi:MAG: sulfatase-like hydrolase/transferase [Xanthomonadaceae bacterium]|nr:sulfatase-like hydrolase/transferase [Xanthomonadaceae bacterium]
MDQFFNIYTTLLVPLGTTLIILTAVRTQHTPKWVLRLASLVPAILLILFLISYLLFFFVGGGINEMILYHLAMGFGEINRLSDFYPLMIFSGGLIGGALLSYWATRRFILPYTPKKSYSPWLLLGLIPTLIFHPLSMNLRTVGTLYYSQPSDAEIAQFDAYDKRPQKAEYLLPEGVKKKNIIYLFLEGVERQFYANDEYFPELMPNLKHIANDHLEFTNIKQLNITSNTITGTVASQCAIPLINRNTGHERNKRNTFLPNGICMGDMLKENGYHNLFLTGYLQTFTNKGIFYTQHGFSPEEIYDYPRMNALHNHQYVLDSWNGGMHDYDLFAFMKEKVDELSQQEAPYFMVINTLDTHFEDGHVDALRCQDVHYDRYKYVMPRVLHCLDGIIEDFYQYLKHHESADDTLLVIASDHLFPAGKITSVLLNIPDRTNTFIVVDFEKMDNRTIDKPGLAFDEGVTILNYAGFPLEAQHFGRNLLNEDNESIYTDFNSVTELDHTLSRWGRLFSRFWLPKQDDASHK